MVKVNQLELFLPKKALEVMQFAGTLREGEHVSLQWNNQGFVPENGTHRMLVTNSDKAKNIVKLVVMGPEVGDVTNDAVSCSVGIPTYQDPTTFPFPQADHSYSSTFPKINTEIDRLTGAIQTPTTSQPQTVTVDTEQNNVSVVEQESETQQQFAVTNTQESTEQNSWSESLSPQTSENVRQILLQLKSENKEGSARSMPNLLLVRAEPSAENAASGDGQQEYILIQQQPDGQKMLMLQQGTGEQIATNDSSSSENVNKRPREGILYICPLCRMKHAGRSAFLAHLKSHTLKQDVLLGISKHITRYEEKLMCNQCMAAMPMSQLDQHQQDCMSLSSPSVSKPSYSMRSSMHQASSQFKSVQACPFLGCNFTSRLTYLLRDHIRVVHGRQNRYTCPHCQKTFPAHQTLWSHKRHCPSIETAVMDVDIAVTQPEEMIMRPNEQENQNSENETESNTVHVISYNPVDDTFTRSQIDRRNAEADDTSQLQVLANAANINQSLITTENSEPVQIQVEATESDQAGTNNADEAPYEVSMSKDEMQAAQGAMMPFSQFERPPTVNTYHITLAPSADNILQPIAGYSTDEEHPDNQSLVIDENNSNLLNMANIASRLIMTSQGETSTVETAVSRQGIVYQDTQALTTMIIDGDQENSAQALTSTEFTQDDEDL